MKLDVEKLREQRKTMTVQQLADYYGLSLKTMSRRLKSLGLTNVSKRADIVTNDVIKDYQDGMTINEIAKKYHCTHETISKRLKKAGIENSRAEGIKRHFADSYEKRWSQIQKDLDDGLSIKEVRNRNHIRLENLYNLMEKHGYRKVSDKKDSCVSISVPNFDKEEEKRLNRKQIFLQRAIEKHGDEYDYSLVDYVNNKTKVKIKCKEHGVFEQTPEKHLEGQGCPGCSVKHMRLTNLQRYGVEYPLQNAEIYQSCQDTVMDEYGVDSVTKSPLVLEKIRQTNQEHYGVDWSCCSDEVKEKRSVTNREKYGGDSPFCDDGVQEKAKAVIFDRYGVTNVMHNEDIKQRVNYTKAKNGTFSSSKSEEELYQRLCDIFGVQDIERQYSDDRYPFACDFYVKSRDMFIELNASWTHGFHWYGLGDSDDETVSTWQLRNTDYYRTAIHTWIKADVKKRQTAMDADLNYVVFWRNDLWDFDLWVAMGCPDGHDYDEMYSYYPIRLIEDSFEVEKMVLDYKNISKIVRQAQFYVFYGREISLWNQNEIYVKRNMAIPLQAWLYQNRWHYLKKLPEELTWFEILRAFKITGILKGYSIFDIKLMRQFLDRYNVTGIYDPCAGWGERMLCSSLYRIPYYGVDINMHLKDGYDFLFGSYDLSRQQVIFGDSSLVSEIKTKFDYNVIFTCPPYLDAEIYSEAGAENLPESDFKIWWDKVLANAIHDNVDYVCIQTNQACRSLFIESVNKYGFLLLDEYFYGNNKVSHFHRKSGGIQKKEFESLLIFGK